MEADRNDAMTSHGPPWRLRELEEINLSRSSQLF